jgi:hypothetical protein
LPARVVARRVVPPITPVDDVAPSQLFSASSVLVRPSAARALRPVWGSRRSTCPGRSRTAASPLLFEALVLALILVMALILAMAVNAVTRLVGEHGSRLWRVLHHYVEGACAGTNLATNSRSYADDRPPSLSGGLTHSLNPTCPRWGKHQMRPCSRFCPCCGCCSPIKKT